MCHPTIYLLTTYFYLLTTYIYLLTTYFYLLTTYFYLLTTYCYLLGTRFLLAFYQLATYLLTAGQSYYSPVCLLTNYYSLH